jgi:two-component system response regulator RegA
MPATSNAQRNAAAILPGDPRAVSTATQSLVHALADRTVLLADSDAIARHRLGRALASHGFEPTLAETVGEALAAIRLAAPAFAVVDTRLSDGSGLTLVEAIHAVKPDACIVILTGYGSIASAFAAAKAGVVDYLTKPSDVDDVTTALLAGARGETPTAPNNPMSAARVRWEHIQRIYELCGHNVSETARRLNMHRRTLQRILGKRAPR